jgi:Zn-finger nucleic acid-binding protein
MPRELHLRPGLHLHCPNCKGVMDRDELGSFCIDRCPDCGGIWLDAAELDKVVALNKSGASKGIIDRLDVGKRVPGGNTGTRTMRHCPRDQSALAATNSPTQQHVVYDRCPACLGTFLDAGELNDLADFTLAERIVGIFRA